MSVFKAEHRTENMPARVALTLIETACATWGKRSAAAREEGLPELQACILVRIYNSPSQESTVSALANALRLTPPTISDSLKALVKKEYLRRRRSHRDRRVVHFSFTRKGRRAAERLSEWPAAIEESIADLDSTHLHRLMGALTRLLRDMVEGGFAVPETMCASCDHFEVESWEADRYLCSLTGRDFGSEGLHTECNRHAPWSRAN